MTPSHWTGLGAVFLGIVAFACGGPAADGGGDEASSSNSLSSTPSASESAAPGACTLSDPATLGCRVGVDRSLDPQRNLHFYTESDSGAVSNGFEVQQYDYYYLYVAEEPGLVPYYRCRTLSDSHLYTTDRGCDGATYEETLGWIAKSELTGTVPLHALYHATTHDYLYTTSAGEVATAEHDGYVSQGISGYVWTAACGGSACTWPSPMRLVGSTMTTAQGFPTTWYGFPVQGTQSFSALSGTVSLTNSKDIYSEILFILKYLPTSAGACTVGRLAGDPPTAGSQTFATFIVKAPEAKTYSLPIDFKMPGGLPMSGCVLVGLNGGTVAASHDVTAAVDLTLTYTAPPETMQSTLGVGGEFCFGQDWGCQGATTDNSQSFARVTPITTAAKLIALYGDISDSTFDGSKSFGAPPTGDWTAENDFFVYHGAGECTFPGGVTSGHVGPGDYYHQIPSSAVHLLSVPRTGKGISVDTAQVYKTFSDVSLEPGDCLVTLWGMHGGGGFDNETQIHALVSE